MEGHQFEYFCAELLLKSGFDSTLVTPGSGDQGVDILATKDGIKYAIQCKNYATPLSNTAIQEVNAGKTFYSCHVGAVMTNSTFTPSAKSLANATGVLLWDRTYVETLMDNAGMIAFDSTCSNECDKIATGEKNYGDYTPFSLSSELRKNLLLLHKPSVLAVILSLCLLIAILVNITSSPKKTTISYNRIISAGHPRVFDTFDSVKGYYDSFSNVSVGSFQSHPKIKNPVITALSYLDYDYIYLYTIDFSSLDNSPEMTLNDAIKIALDYIPIDIVLSVYDFEKAIYKKLDDGSVSYECYYTEKDTNTYPNYYTSGKRSIPMQHGFSLIIKESTTHKYTIDLGDDWYSNKYDTDPVIGKGTTQEELQSHKKWNFNLEMYS